jgi:hypothetical protein
MNLYRGRAGEVLQTRNLIVIELVVWVICVVAFIALMRQTLLTRMNTFTHDSLYWYYPIYHFWAESLLQGRWPLWNPFSHGGEPFYPLLLQARLLDPNSYVVLAVGSWVTNCKLPCQGDTVKGELPAVI